MQGSWIDLGGLGFLTGSAVSGGISGSIAIAAINEAAAIEIFENRPFR
jgi:hypothetical protein